MTALSSSSITNSRVLFQFKNNKEPAHDFSNSKVKQDLPTLHQKVSRKYHFNPESINFNNSHPRCVMLPYC